jgi:hypothetical protein
MLVDAVAKQVASIADQKLNITTSTSEQLAAFCALRSVLQ